MNATQIIAVLREAGWPDDKDLLSKMTAICFGESSGDPHARNPRTGNRNPQTGELSIGLFQINIAAHGAKYGSEEELYNPVANAEAALDLYYHHGGFRNWGAYTNGSYSKYLSQARNAYDGFANTNEGDAAQVDNTSDNTIATYSGLGFLAIIIVLGSFLMGGE